MTVDREQIRRDADRDFPEPAHHAWHDEWLHHRRLARHISDLLAELEQAEKEISRLAGAKQELAESQALTRTYAAALKNAELPETEGA